MGQRSTNNVGADIVAKGKVPGNGEDLVDSSSTADRRRDDYVHPPLSVVLELVEDGLAEERRIVS
jgi:hypothetical protein